MTRRLFTSCQNVDLNWLKVSHPDSVPRSKIPSRVLSQVFCLYGRYAAVLLIEKKCRAHLWLSQTGKFKLCDSRSISRFGIYHCFREKSYVPCQISQLKKMQLRNRLPSLCQSAGERSKPVLPYLYTTAVEMRVTSVLMQVALVTNDEGIPNSWLPK